MNTNDSIHNRNAETAPRLRFNNEQMLQNHIVYPYGFPMTSLFYPISQPVIMTTNHSQPLNLTPNDQNTEQGGIMSFGNEMNVSQPTYRILNWHEIADNYEGNEEKPKCGKLKDNVYFTQRSASSDMYMIFDKKSDYINNFVNYYFSDKNLARDQKLVALMDDKGIVPLSALKEFPKLQQVDTTIEDLLKAFQSNNFVCAVDMPNNVKGAQRRDRLCSADIINKNGFDKSPYSADQINTEALVNNQTPVLSTVSDLNMTIQSNDNVSGQNPPFYLYNHATLVPTIYSQPVGLMPAASSINGIQAYNPYIMTQFPYATHTAPNPVGLNPSQNHLYSSPLAVWASQDYNNHGTLISQIPYMSSNHGIMPGNARFLPSSNVANVNAGNFNAPIQAAAVTPEPAVNRIN